MKIFLHNSKKNSQKIAALTQMLILSLIKMESLKWWEVRQNALYSNKHTDMDMTSGAFEIASR